MSALQMADNKDKKELQKWVQMEKPNPEEKIKAITDIYNRLAIDKLLQNKKNEYLSAAVLALDKISVDIGCKHILRTLAEKLMVRTI